MPPITAVDRELDAKLLAVLDARKRAGLSAQGLFNLVQPTMEEPEDVTLAHVTRRLDTLRLQGRVTASDTATRVWKRVRA